LIQRNLFGYVYQHKDIASIDTTEFIWLRFDVIVRHRSLMADKSGRSAGCFYLLYTIYRNCGYDKDI